MDRENNAKGSNQQIKTKESLKVTEKDEGYKKWEQGPLTHMHNNYFQDANEERVGGQSTIFDQKKSTKNIASHAH